MSITFKRAESFIKPERQEQVPNGYYIRHSFSTENVVDEKTEEILVKHIYQEAFLTNEQYQMFLLTSAISGVDYSSDAYIAYEKALDTGVEYPVSEGGNGLIYKPKWVKEANGDKGIYFALLDDWNTLGGEQLIPALPLWDATEKPENVRNFTQSEFKALMAFLALKQEELFNTYKKAKGQE